MQPCAPPGASPYRESRAGSCHGGCGTDAVVGTALLRHARSRPIARLGRTTAKSRGPGPTKRLAHRRTQKSRCQEPPRRQRHGRGRRTGAPSSRTQPTDCKARAYDGAESRAWPTKRLEHRRTQKAVPGAATKATARTRSSKRRSFVTHARGPIGGFGPVTAAGRLRQTATQRFRRRSSAGNAGPTLRWPSLRRRPAR